MSDLSDKLNELAFKAMEMEAELLNAGAIGNNFLESIKSKVFKKAEGDLSNFYLSYIAELNDYRKYYRITSFVEIIINNG